MSNFEAFETPGPISATVEIEVGNIRVTAGKRTDTTVEVRPGGGGSSADAQAAEQTRITYSGGQLTVRGPKKRSLFGKPGSVDVVVELPAGSQVSGGTQVGGFVGEGPLGDCRIKVALGDIQVQDAATVRLGTSLGDIVVDRVSGDADISGGGRLRVGEIAGAATVANSNGEITLDEITGELRAKSANGAIAIGRAHAGLHATSANGSIRVEEVARGRVDIKTAAGSIDIGIREATAAWLDVHSRIGQVRNLLEVTEGPGDSGEDTVEVRAVTGAGDITVRRSTV